MFAPKPPVVKTTALAEIVFSLPSIVTFTPVTLPSFSFTLVTSALTNKGISRSDTLRNNPFTKYSPTAEPSAGR